MGLTTPGQRSSPGLLLELCAKLLLCVRGPVEVGGGNGLGAGSGYRRIVTRTEVFE